MGERHVRIAATGRYVPERLVTNAELEKIVGEPFDEWLVKNVGIKERHFMAPDERTSDLAVKAANEALARANVKPEELDLIVIATDTPDYLSPATAAVVQHKLGASKAGVLDVNSACAGFVSALNLAAGAMKSDDGLSKVLVVGAYGMTRFVDYKDKRTCTLFADGAGAVVLESSDRPGYLAGKMVAAGEYHEALGVYTGGTARPATEENVREGGPPTVRFVKKFPATFNTERWPVLVKETLGRVGLTVRDVKLFVFTQLNLRAIEATMGALEVPMERTHWTMDKWGYTGSACIPMTLDDAVSDKRVGEGDVVVLCATGGGLAMACSVLRW